VLACDRRVAMRDVVRTIVGAFVPCAFVPCALGARACRTAHTLRGAARTGREKYTYSVSICYVRCV